MLVRNSASNLNINNLIEIFVGLVYKNRRPIEIRGLGRFFRLLKGRCPNF